MITLVAFIGLNSQSPLHFYGRFLLLHALIRIDILANKCIIESRKQAIAKAKSSFHEVSQLFRVTLVLEVNFAVLISAV